jgi:putative inorganic carbon (HCO3(-)) transporter
MTAALLIAKLSLLGTLAAFLLLFLGARRLRRTLAAALILLAVALGVSAAIAIEGGRALHFISAHTPYVAGGAVLGLATLAVLTWVVHRYPGWAVPAIVVLMPLRTTVGAGGTTANLLIPLYLVTVAVLISELVVRDRLRPPEGPQREPLRIALAVVIALGGLSTLWAGYGYTGLDKAFLAGLVKILAFYVPFAAIFYLVVRYARSVADVTRLFLTVIWSAVGFSLIGIAQYAGHFVFFNRASIEHAYKIGQGWRVNSLFWDPNMFSRFLIVALLICLTLALVTPARRRRLAAAAAVIAGANVLTLSRSGWIGLLIGLILFSYLWLGRRRGTYVTVAAVIVIGAGLGALFALRSPWRHGILDHPWGINRLTGGRYYLAQGGIRMFEDHPLTGVGLGDFPLAYYPKYRDRHASKVLRDSHTTPITFLAEEGILGVLAYLAVLVTFFATALRADRREHQPEALLAGAASRAGPPQGPAAAPAPFTTSLVVASDPPDPPGGGVLNAPAGGGTPAPDAEPTPSALARRRLRLVQAGLAAAVLATVVHSLVYNAWFEDPYLWLLLAVSVALRYRLTGWPEEPRHARPRPRRVLTPPDRT